MVSEASEDPPPVSGLLDGAAEVLSAVRRDGCRSRSEIMHRTGLTRMVTAQRTQQLTDLGLLRQEGLGPSRGGRKPRQLEFRPEGRLLVGYVGWTSIDVAVADPRGRLLVHLDEPSDVTEGPEAVLSRVESLCDRVLANTEELGFVWGVGIGIPGPVEYSTGRTVSPPGMPGWDDYPVRERIAARFGAPAWVDKDVNVMMLGEWREGAARGFDDAVFAKLGTGTGVGLISAGRVHRGAQGCAGDVFHLLRLATRVQPNGFPLPTESPGSWPTASIVRIARQLADDGDSRWLADATAAGTPVTIELVAEAAAHGDPAVIDLLRSAGEIMGTALASVVSLFNPSLLVIGGGMSNVGDDYLAAIREIVHGRAKPLATRDLRIVKAQLGVTAGVVGAAAMVLDELFSKENLAWTVRRWASARA